MIFNFNAAEVFDIAINIEENGKQFYDRSQAIVKDPEVRKLFAELAQEEIKHKEKFTTLKGKLPPSAGAGAVFDPDHELNLYLKMMADQHVFVTTEGVEAQLGKIESAVDALKMAMEFEKDSVIFFLTMQDATEEAQGKAFLGALVKEEQEHLRRLAIEAKRISGK